MEFKKLKIKDLKPAKYNPRVELQPGDPEYEKIKKSIVEIGYCDPIIINKDKTVISGHQRLNVLKDLGKTEIEVVQVSLTKTKEKALNVALNKITGRWDSDALENLLRDLSTDDIDLTLTGFDEDEIEDMLFDSDEEDGEYKENARMNTVKAYNLQLYDENDVDGFYQMPIIRNDHFIPEEMVGFNYAKTLPDKSVGIHCFVDDYQFERLWNRPEQYIDVISKYSCILSPDFSLYMNMPMAMKVWNTYRSRMLGQYWQKCGIKVIPTISWAEPDTFTFCFDGIPEGSIVAVSTVGIKREDETLKIWKAGMDAMIEKIHPEAILVYGGEVPYTYPNGCKVKYYENLVTERMKENK